MSPTYKLTQEEQETIIRGCAGKQEWIIYTADPRIIRKFKKLGYKVDQEDQYGGIWVTVPFRVVRFGRLEKRIMSEDQKAKIRHRLKLIPRV